MLVCVPKIDRSSTDVPRIPCVITQVHGERILTYSLTTKYGPLKNKLRSGELQEYSGTVTIENNNDTLRPLSLREAVRKFHPENKFTKSSCKCTSGRV